VNIMFPFSVTAGKILTTRRNEVSRLNQAQVRTC
jgi:hypothetical protein